MKVLIVDDSLVYRSTIEKVLAELDGVEVVQKVKDGRAAIDYLKDNQVDLMTLDLEMPILDGIGVLNEVQGLSNKPKIIVFAAQTSRGAKSALDAFKLGAYDVVAKPTAISTSMDQSMDHVRSSLQPKVLSLVPGNTLSSTPAPASKAESAYERMIAQNLPAKEPPKSYVKTNLRTFRPKVVVLGSSTGGPMALNEVFANLRPNLSVPILIAQHMPPVFTQQLAKRLETLSGIPTREAKNGEILETGVYIAPGDYHMVLKDDGEHVRILLNQGPLRNSVRPCVDFLFESAVEVYGPRVAGVVLTGMGFDGRDGCTAIKEKGGGVLLQNKDTCVVWGMPRGVFEKGAYDEEGNLGHISERINLWTHPL